MDDHSCLLEIKYAYLSQTTTRIQEQIVIHEQWCKESRHREGPLSLVGVYNFIRPPKNMFLMGMYILSNTHQG